jgi:O-antigen ligase
VKGFSRLVLLALAWGALTAGARYPWAYWPLAAVCAGLGLWGLVSCRSWARREWRTLATALALLGGAIAVQAVPVPYGVFAGLTPAADRFLQSYQIGFLLNRPAWHALSIAPGATLQILALYAAFALFLLGLVDALGRIRLERFVVRLIGLGVALAVFGVVQRAAAGIEPLIYGFWKAPPLSTPFGPFFNRNHFAGWTIMTLSLAMGYAVAALRASDHPRVASPGEWMRWLATPEASRFLVSAFAALAMATALVVTGSRSGVAAFGLAVIVFGGLVIRQAAGRTSRRIAIAAMAMLFVGAIAWAGTHSTLARFSLASADLPGRVAAWRDTLRIAGDFPLVGSGLGTYGQTMIVYQTGDRIAMFAHAHNEYLQLLAEGGALVVLPALGALAMIVALGRRRLQEAAAHAGPAAGPRGVAPEALAFWLRAGATAGLVGIAAQSVVDYSLQRPGNAVLFVVLLGVLLHRPRTSRTAPAVRAAAY